MRRRMFLGGLLLAPLAAAEGATVIRNAKILTVTKGSFARKAGIMVMAGAIQK